MKLENLQNWSFLFFDHKETKEPKIQNRRGTSSEIGTVYKNINLTNEIIHFKQGTQAFDQQHETDTSFASIMTFMNIVVFCLLYTLS